VRITRLHGICLLLQNDVHALHYFDASFERPNSGLPGRHIDAHAVGSPRPRLNSRSGANRIAAPIKALTSKPMMPLPKCNPIALQANRDDGALDDVYKHLKATATDDSPSQCISHEICPMTSSSRTLRRLSSDATKAKQGSL